jgi:1,2-phenylacetyl-CoA epoxidase catalytic subunit
MQDPEIKELNVKLDSFSTVLGTIAKDIALIKNDFHHEINNVKKDVAELTEKYEKKADKNDNRRYDWLKSVALVLFTFVLTQTANYLNGGKKDETTGEVVKTLRDISETMKTINQKQNGK